MTKLTRSMQQSEIQLGKFGCDLSCDASTQLETGADGEEIADEADLGSNAMGMCDNINGGCLTCRSTKFLDMTNKPHLCVGTCPQKSFTKLEYYNPDGAGATAINVRLQSHKVCVNSCGNGFYTKVAGKHCEACDMSCVQCKGPNPNHCTGCSENLYLYNNICFATCP
jgi:hypothetical protein